MTRKIIYTTLNKIRKHNPCEDGWEKLLKHLGRTKADDVKLKFSTICTSNGIDDALWCLRSISPEYDREIRLLAADYAESVLHIFEKSHPNDERPRLAIKAARDFAGGRITETERAGAGAAAGAAAGASARAAARAAAWDATGAAAGASARAAARAAAWDATGDAAWDAAWAAAWDATGDAAWDAAWAAAWDAAWAAERELQEKLLIRYFG